MIDKIKTAWNKHVHSLRIRMLVAIILSIVFAIIVYLVIRGAFISWIENSYNTEESRKERYDGYMSDLREFVKDNNLSSKDTAKITKWLRGTRNVYLFLYRDNQLFFTAGMDDEEPTDKDDASEQEKPSDTNDSTGESGSQNTPGDVGSGGSDGENSDTGTGENTPNKNPGTESGSGGASRPGNGITVDYPTKEEILQHAADNGLQPLELSDGTLLASFVDLSEYFYYNLANIVSILGALFILVIILMIYFQSIISKISRLADDVSSVYEIDMNREIRTSGGKDELSELSRNVEQMRQSILDGLKKEREALEANSELITSMSHDIRTPLTVLLGYLDIMKTYSTDANMQEYIKASETTALRLKEFSDDMFRYFLVFGGREIEASIADYDAGTLFDQLFSEHILLMRERGYDVEWNDGDYQPQNLTVSTDAPKVMRVIDNLFSNMYKYAERDEKISITLHSSGDVLKITLLNTVKTVDQETESHGVGIRTCEKICDALKIGFQYSAFEENGKKLFETTLEFAIKNN